jgi:pyruvate,orthophosphate dikinase
VPASPGVATGPFVLDPDAAVRSAVPVLLVRHDTSTEDLEGLAAAAGLVTVSGSRTSHAAVVARQLGRPCIVGCESLRLDPASGRIAAGDQRFAEGAILTMDGERGEIWLGAIPVVSERPSALIDVVRGWREPMARADAPVTVTSS